MADKQKGSYGADDISVLEGLEPVRKRPGMYIGGTGTEGLHHLVWEIFDNSRDEAMGGFANDIEVTLLPGNRIRVTDNGRGIPVDIHKQTKVSALETVAGIVLMSFFPIMTVYCFVQICLNEAHDCRLLDRLSYLFRQLDDWFRRLFLIQHNF